MSFHGRKRERDRKRERERDGGRERDRDREREGERLIIYDVSIMQGPVSSSSHLH